MLSYHQNNENSPKIINMNGKKATSVPVAIRSFLMSLISFWRNTFRSYQTVPSFISEGGWERWLLYPLPLRESEVNEGLGPKTSDDILCRGPGIPGSGLGDSPGWWDMMSEKRCTSLDGWCPGMGWSMPPKGVPVGPDDGTKGRSTGVWACEDGGPWGKKS